MMGKRYCFAECDTGIVPSFLDPDCSRTDNPDTIGFAILRVVPLVPAVIGLILLLVIIINGIKIAMSGENEEEKKKGIKGLTNGLLGAGILALVIAVISIFESIFKVKILYGFGS